MPNYSESFLSKLLDEGSTEAIRTHNVEESDMTTEEERKVFRFITDYARENRGAAPDFRDVVEQFPGFYYREGVTSSFRWLAKELKSETAKREFIALINDPDTQRQLQAENGTEFIENYLRPKLESITMRTSVREKVGTDIKRDSEKFIEEYRKRKAGESFRIWKSKFPGINNAIGGYYSGNPYAWFGRSGRGKSVFVMEEAIEAAVQGANVLVWAMEMSWFEWMARAYASISARVSGTVEKIDDVDYEVGFENKRLLSGSLSEGYEKGFEIFLAQLNEIIPGNITIRAVDDEDFIRRNVRQLETDIIHTDADIVVIDPLYYMQYETNTSRTKGGDAAETSVKIRALAGRTKTVIHVITQAEEIADEQDEEGNRELQPPQRKAVKKTKAILEDSVNLFGIDTADGRGIIEIGKGRQGGEGTQVEVVYQPNFGIVQEVSKETLSAESFTQEF